MNQAPKPKPVQELTDDELYDALREQVNASRNTGVHDRPRTREIAAEWQRRGWNMRSPSEL